VNRSLRPFKVEHGLFCRLVIAPKPADRANPAGLHNKRMEAACRALRALSLTSDLPEVTGVAQRMARLWTMARALPNLPPPFQFTEADAVRMAMDAHATREAA
jgi:hypothetical protein